MFLVLCYFLFCCSFVIGDSTDDLINYHYHPPYAGMEVIRQPSSVKTIDLKCKKSCKKRITWNFQPCKPDENCAPGLSQKLNITIIKNKQCGETYRIQNPKKHNSGIYTCQENAQTIKTFKVEIVGEPDYKSPPKILDISPRKLNVSKHANVIIKCEVQSEFYPAIIWLKETDSNINDTISYLDKFYKTINTPKNNMYSSKNDVFLSKLNIEDVNMYGSGFYVCLAISETGRDFKTVEINIIDQAKSNLPYLSHFFLFLVPFSLILVPIIFWLCYYRKKLKRKPPIVKTEAAGLVKPILTVSHSHC